MRYSSLKKGPLLWNTEVARWPTWPARLPITLCAPTFGYHVAAATLKHPGVVWARWAVAGSAHGRARPS